MNNRLLNTNKLNELLYKLEYLSRHMGRRNIKKAFTNGIENIYIINLDRADKRWEELKEELKRIKINDKTLLDISTRFSAIDAKIDNLEIENKVTPYYYLSDQLKVEPIKNYSLNGNDYKIKMSKQEIAVSLSHIGVWEKMLEDDFNYALILEDDIYFDKSFNRVIDPIWDEASHLDFDILFLSFGYVKGVDESAIEKKQTVHKVNAGIWQASGYVLSKKGLIKLLSMLPLYSPVDLWFNLKFDELEAYMINHPIIKQRNDFTSSNNYSIMPVLESLGLFSNDTPYEINKKDKLPKIAVYGEIGTGLDALETALSVIGYSCCHKLPNTNRFFNAFFNIDNIKNAKIICTDRINYKKYKKIYKDVLYLDNNEKNKWKILAEFLNIKCPNNEYPNIEDKEFQEYNLIDEIKHDLEWDELPWINEGQGFTIDKEYNFNEELKYSIYYRNDTFSGNKSIFNEENVNILENGTIELNLKEETGSLKDYTSAAIGLNEKTLYGKYSVVIKPSGIEGTITGVFLYRSNPHQEIDIEFLGKNHYGFLTNVFYNPGIEGTKSEFGNRGTPIWISLDFDVTKEYHKYEIEWTPTYIKYFVDDKEVYRRNIWNPTPIPNLPMEFNINIWNSNSKELVGKLDNNNLPTSSKVKSLKINSGGSANV